MAFPSMTFHKHQSHSSSLILLYDICCQFLNIYISVSTFQLWWKHNHYEYLLFQFPCRYCFLIEWENVFNTLKIWIPYMNREQKYRRYQIPFVSVWVAMPCEAICKKQKNLIHLLMNTMKKKTKEKKIEFAWRSLCAFHIW